MSFPPKLVTKELELSFWILDPWTRMQSTQLSFYPFSGSITSDCIPYLPWSWQSRSSKNYEEFASGRKFFHRISCDLKNLCGQQKFPPGLGYINSTCSCTNAVFSLNDILMTLCMPSGNIKYVRSQFRKKYNCFLSNAY